MIYQNLEIITGTVGRWLLGKIDRAINQITFFWVCMKSVARYRTNGRRLMKQIIVQQIYFTGVQSFELIAGLAFILGSILFVEGVHQLSQLGSLDELSVLITVILIRELGPLLTAIVLIIRSGSAISMEIGYMNVLGEIEALEMQGVSTYHFLAAPRIIAFMISLFCLIILFDLTAIIGGFLVFALLHGITVSQLIQNMAAGLTQGDFMIVAAKGLCFGITIPTICLYHGFMARDVITNVPPMVSMALVDCLIYCVLFNIIISAAFMS